MIVCFKFANVALRDQYYSKTDRILNFVHLHKQFKISSGREFNLIHHYRNNFPDVLLLKDV